MIAAGLLYLGLFALAAGMTRHRPALLGRWHRTPFATKHLPLIGWTLVGLSLAAVLPGPGWGIALVTWCGLAPLAAGIILLGLTYRAIVPQAGLAVAMILIVAGLL